LEKVNGVGEDVEALGNYKAGGKFHFGEVNHVHRWSEEEHEESKHHYNCHYLFVYAQDFSCKQVLEATERWHTKSLEKQKTIEAESDVFR
jgi:hypothetical protein